MLILLASPLSPWANMMSTFKSKLESIYTCR